MAEHGESSYRRFLHGDKTALEELVRTYSDALVRFALGYVKDPDVAEDVMEDTFAALYMKAPRLRDEGRLRAYLYRIARNKCMDYLRRHREDIPLEDVENLLSGCDAETDLARKERNRLLYDCIQKLPEQYREVLQLMYFDGFDLVQTGKIMGRNPKQVYNLHTRAKNALRKLLQKEGISYEDLS